MQFKVPPEELDSINRNLLFTRGEPKACLREMLRVWLQLASPHAGELSALVSALGKHSVGKSQLAAKLQMDGADYLKRRLVYVLSLFW